MHPVFTVYFNMKNYLLRKTKHQIEVKRISPQEAKSLREDWTQCLCSEAFLREESLLKNAKHTDETIEYKILWDYFKKVNLFLPHESIPNKRVTTDIDGTSKLIRRPNENNAIEIAFRRKTKSGNLERCATSPNTCYISNSDRELFFHDVKYAGVIKRGEYGDRYLLYPSCGNEYLRWSEIMDNEYIRLSGINFKKYQREHTMPIRLNKEENALAWRKLVEAYSNLPLEKVRMAFACLAEEHLCKVNESFDWLYDKDGFFIEEVKYFDGITELRAFVQPLTLGEIQHATSLVRKLFD